MVSLGSVVHNPQVVAQLKSKGLDVIASLEEVSDRPVAITAHGVSESVVRDLETRAASRSSTPPARSSRARSSGRSASPKKASP